MKTMTALIVCAGTAAAVVAAPIGVDFGDPGNLTAGNYNNVDFNQNPIFNLVDTDGNGTGIALDMTDAFWPGSNQGGTGSPSGDAAGIPSSATADNLFGSLMQFGNFLEPTGGFVMSGLDASGALSYDLMFFGSRMGVSDNRETQYTVSGANSGVGLLDTANNTSNVVYVRGIRADANGEISVSVTAGPNNTNSFGFYYLGYMELTVVPAPGAAALLGLGSFVAVRRRR